MNIVLFGSCYFSWNGIFAKVFKKYNHKVIPFSGAHFGSVSFLYNIYQERNKKLLDDSDFIVISLTERSFFRYKDIKYNETILSNYYWFYKKLYMLNKKVIVIIFHFIDINEITESNLFFHKSQCFKYGFNLINMYEYCIKQDILNFYINYYDYVHPVEQLMYTLAEAICQNIEHFKSPKKLDIEDFIPDFKIIEIDKIDGKNERVVVKKRSYLYSKNILKIGDEQFYISEEFEGYNILGVHTWNEVLEDSKYSYLTLSNSKLKLSKFIRPFEAFSEIYTHNFTIDNKTSIFSNEIVEDLYKEEDILGYLEELNTQKLVKNTYTGLIGILLVKCDDKYLVKYNDIKKCNIVDEEFNCNYILSFMDNYKNFTEQYIKRTISYKDKNIQSKNQNCQIKLQDNILPFQAKYGTAKTRIQNQLSYKLGQAMIVNSKSILGYIRMPFVLSYIKDKHKQEQKIYQEKIKKDPSLALPPLESYPDYQEALRFKNHLSYKLGQALIQANKTWYGGGYIKLLFEIRKLKREFKQK